MFRVEARFGSWSEVSMMDLRGVMVKASDN